MKFAWGLIKNWIVFLLHPRDVFPGLTRQDKIKSVIFYFFFFTILSASLSFFIQYLCREMYNRKIIPYPVNMKWSLSEINFIHATLLGPLAEELIFRLSLRFKSIYLSISTSVLLFLVITVYIKKIVWFYNGWYVIGNACIIFSMAVLLNFLINRFEYRLKIFWSEHMGSVFYFSAVAFGLCHLVNYHTEHYSVILLCPFFLLPKIVMGLNAGFFRLRHGFMLCFILHSFNNLIPFLIVKCF